ncbi:hypothetical protein Q9L58_004649 [Maublancomyces gigas]|uniref:Uncharacterized protein n=1 Tax=Discina gigas TaxID=1032678 RepID=A0ABR3GKF0_9PEZI
MATPNDRIATADKARLDRILKATVKPPKPNDKAYNEAYNYAVSSIMGELDRLIFKTPAQAAYRAYVVREIAKRNLAELILDKQAPTVQVIFNFTNGKDTIEVNLNYDNPAHDPKKMLNSVVNREREMYPAGVWAGNFKPYLDGLYADRWNMYPHFGWELSCMKVDTAGHAYITFTDMVMLRASRPPDVLTSTKVRPSSHQCTPEGSMTGTYKAYVFLPEARAAEEERIGNEERTAKKELVSKYGQPAH